MQKLMTIILVFQTAFALSQDKTQFQIDFIEYTKKCNYRVFRDYNKQVEVNNNPIFYYTEQAILYEEAFNFGKAFENNAIALGVYQKLDFDEYYWGDDLLLEQCLNSNSKCNYKIDFSSKLNHRYNTSKQKLEKEKAEQDRLVKKYKRKIDSLNNEVAKKEESMKLYQDTINTNEITYAEYSGNVNDVYNQLKPLLPYSDQVDTFLLSGNSTVYINCHKSIKDETDYQAGVCDVGKICTKETKDFALFIAKGSLPAKIPANIKIPVIIVSIYGIADGIGERGRWTDSEFTTSADYYKDDNNVNEYWGYEQVDTADIRTIVRGRYSKKSANDIYIQLQDSRQLSNKILGYLRAFCAYEEIKGFINKTYKDRHTNKLKVKPIYKLYSISLNSKYKHKKYRGVRIKINTEGLVKHHKEKRDNLHAEIQADKEERDRCKAARDKAKTRSEKLAESLNRQDVINQTAQDIVNKRRNNTSN